MFSTTFRILAKELLRLSTLLQRAATPDDVIAAVRGDPEHKLHPVFRNLASTQAWTARLAWLINRMRLEQGLPMSLLSEDPDIIADLRDHYHRCTALGAAVAEVTRACAEHWRSRGTRAILRKSGH